ncbi:MAG: C10 family peptidase [Prevotella sp.]|nr:C10 family peptidase [Prevotella sp.]
MKKRLLIARVAMTMVLAAVGVSAWADEVTAEQALEQAQQFVSSHNRRKSAPTVKSAGQVSGLYMFNVSSGGFVIVSNDDQTVPILGFGESGSIDPDDLPDNMRAWLQGYAEQIAWLQNGLTPDPSPVGEGSIYSQGGFPTEEVTTPLSNRRGVGGEATKTAIAPLVQTNWNQGRPYNDLCPTIDGTRTVTGCVATTVAQLMYYHQWPEKDCTAIDGYTTTTLDKNKAVYELDVSGLDATTFAWDKMIANYTPVNAETGKRYLTGTTEQQQAVATLMRYCGTALQMSYGLSANGGSSAYGEAIPYALKHCFGYDGGIQHCYRKNYSYTAWVDLIYSELEASRPVALGGQSTGGGHSFICDGYQYDNDADYFHINWGWAGSSDGYFQLSALNPYEQGIGGSSSLDGFSFSQDAVIGIQKPVDGNADYCLSLEGLRLGSPDGAAASKTYVRDGETKAFTDISLYFLVYSYNYGSKAYDVSVQLVDGSGNVIQTLGGQEKQTKTWDEHISATLTNLSIDGTVADGTYYIKVMSRPTGSSDWQECFDGDAYKLTAVISDDELTISVPLPSNTKPASVTFAVSGESATGSEQTVTATVTGGTGDYSGNLVLRVNGSAVMGQIAYIPAGKEVVLNFSYIPSYVGDNTLTLWTHKSDGKQITGSETVSIGTLIIDNNSSKNTGLIEKNDKRTGDVKLAGRTLYKDDDWNTICLPFNLALEGSPLKGATIMTLDVESKESDGVTYKTRFDSDGTLYLSFVSASTITAGTPYIIKWSEGTDLTEPVFTDVTITQGFNDIVSNDRKVQFQGRYAAVTYTAEDKSTLLMSGNNTLYYPQPDLTSTNAPQYPSIGACRAYFALNGITAGDPASDVRAFVLNFGDEVDGISDISTSRNDEISNDAWYTLDGRRLSAKPTAPGLYIHGNKKVMVDAVGIR